MMTRASDIWGQTDPVRFRVRVAMHCWGPPKCVSTTSLVKIRKIRVSVDFSIADPDGQEP
jgi:hypothetical protein